MSDNRLEREMDGWIGASVAVMRVLLWSVVVKKELSRRAKLSIYWSIFVSNLTYGYEIWIVTQKKRLRIQASEIVSFGEWLCSALAIG